MSSGRDVKGLLEILQSHASLNFTLTYDTEGRPSRYEYLTNRPNPKIAQLNTEVDNLKHQLEQVRNENGILTKKVKEMEETIRQNDRDKNTSDENQKNLCDHINYYSKILKLNQSSIPSRGL